MHRFQVPKPATPWAGRVKQLLRVVAASGRRNKPGPAAGLAKHGAHQVPGFGAAKGKLAKHHALGARAYRLRPVAAHEAPNGARLQLQKHLGLILPSHNAAGALAVQKPREDALQEALAVSGEALPNAAPRLLKAWEKVPVHAHVLMGMLVG